VVEATASKGSIPIYLRGIGTAAPALTVTLHSRVDGQIMSVHFTEGQFVHAGDLLVEIDPRPYEATLAQVQGTLAHDTALYNNAELDYQRYLTLYNQKIVSQQQMDTQSALVNEYKGAMAADQAAIETAKLNLTYSHVTAPIDGRIGLRLADPGNIVHANDTQGLAVITQVQPIAVLFSLPQEDLPQVYSQLRAGHHPPVVAFDSTNTKQLAVGDLLTIDNSIDATTGTFKSKAMFNNQDNALFPNQFVNARLEVGTDTGLTIVPPPAIQRGPQGTYVFVVSDDNTVTSRPVTVARTEGNLVGLSAGLRAGENVVVDGADKLQDGTKVAASMESTAAAAAPDGTSSTGTAAVAPAAGSSNTATSGTATTPVSSPGKGHKRKPGTAAGEPASHPGR
jgi:multidrug efflux system membrane fusion protein